MTEQSKTPDNRWIYHFLVFEIACLVCMAAVWFFGEGLKSYILHNLPENWRVSTPEDAWYPLMICGIFCFQTAAMIFFFVAKKFYPKTQMEPIAKYTITLLSVPVLLGMAYFLLWRPVIHIMVLADMT